MQVFRCVLSGSYHRDFASLEMEYRELVVLGCQVLSPHRLDFTNLNQEFVRDRAEITLSSTEIEKHHLLAIRQSDFMWLHCPGGYIGNSAALEIGYALACNMPIFSKNQPNETVLKEFIKLVPSAFMAIEHLRNVVHR